MMVHCRVKSPEAWANYVFIIENGGRFNPYMKRNWFGFRARFLVKPIIEPDFVVDIPDEDILTGIENGRYFKQT